MINALPNGNFFFLTASWRRQTGLPSCPPTRRSSTPVTRLNSCYF